MHPPKPAAESFGTILVPLDGSPLAEQALPVAATIAHRSGATLDLVTVRASLAEPVPLVGVAEEAEALDREARTQKEAYLTAAVSAITTTHGVEATWAVPELHHTVAHTLVHHAGVKHAGLVVMMTHGHGGVSRLWLGSVADHLLRRTTIPVLLLRAGAAAPHTEYRQIVIALDGSAESAQIVGPAVALGSLVADAHYTLIQVVEPPISLITRMALQPAHLRPHWREQRENAARSFLERIAEPLRQRGHSVATQIIAERGVSEQILCFADGRSADLVAVGTHGARGVERLLLGSVADKVVRGAAQAVLVVPTQPAPV